MSKSEEFAAACERLTLAREIKRQEANLAHAIRIVDQKKARLAQLERESRARDEAQRNLASLHTRLALGVDADAVPWFNASVRS